MSGPSASQVYTWEPSNRAIAERYGLDPADVLRFDTNTSPAPPTELISAVLGEPFDPSLNEYPDSSYRELTDAAAEYLGVDPKRIIVGAGADELLDLVGKTWLGEGRRAVIPVPTYAMYPVLSGQRGAELDRVPRLGPEGAFGLDLDALLPRLDGAAVLWLCSPNNPTGAEEEASTLQAVLEAAASVDGADGVDGSPVVVLDEAYAEFTGRTAVPWTERFPRLLVVRTISKAFGLAGARVGYATASRELIASLERVRPPGSISTVSATLGSAALRAPALAEENVARLVAERDRLASDLATLGWTVHPSVTNFLLLDAGSADRADALAEHLLRAGIVPRTFPVDHPVAGHLRLTVRSRSQNERLLEALAGFGA